MSSKIFLTLALLATTFGFDSIPAICSSGINCPTAPCLTVGGFSYSINDFNAWSFGDFIINSGDVEGRVACQGNFNAGTTSGVSVGNTVSYDSNLPYSLIVGKDASWTNGQVHPTDAGIFVGGNFSGASYLSTSVKGGCSSSGCLDSTFNTMKNYYVQVSSLLAAQTSTAATIVYQSLVINCSSSITYVSISASDFNSITSMTIGSTCNVESSYIVINIVGSESVVFSGDYTSSKSYNVLFNIAGSSSVQVATSVYGDIMCPSSSYSQTSGAVTGQVVAGTVTAVVQINDGSSLSSNDTTTASAPQSARATFTYLTVCSGSTGSASASSGTPASTASGSASTASGSASASGTGSASASSDSGSASASGTGSASASSASGSASETGSASASGTGSASETGSASASSDSGSASGSASASGTGSASASSDSGSASASTASGSASASANGSGPVINNEGEGSSATGLRVAAAFIALMALIA